MTFITAEASRCPVLPYCAGGTAIAYRPSRSAAQRRARLSGLYTQTRTRVRSAALPRLPYPSPSTVDLAHGRFGVFLVVRRQRPASPARESDGVADLDAGRSIGGRSTVASVFSIGVRFQNSILRCMLTFLASLSSVSVVEPDRSTNRCGVFRWWPWRFSCARNAGWNWPAHLMPPQGGRPCPQRAAARGAKLTGEANRVFPASHTRQSRTVGDFRPSWSGEHVRDGEGNRTDV